MNYQLIAPAVDKILALGKNDSKGHFGWSNHNTSPVLSRTVTAQVIITLSKCAEHEPNEQKKIKILEDIEKGFVFIKSEFEKGNCELPTYAFTLLAHLEHHSRFSKIHDLDVELIKTCTEELENDFYSEDEKAYRYMNDNERKFFPTYLVLQSFLRLLETIETDNSILKINEADLLTKIDNCFTYIYTKLAKNIEKLETQSFSISAEYLSIGIQISKYYEDYSIKYNRIKEIIDTKDAIKKSVAFFHTNLEDKLFPEWSITIRETPFVLIYISNLISGLLKYRDELDETGLNLLHRLSYFICFDNRIQNFDTDGGIISTKMDKEPVWGTAHSINAILKLDYSLNELKLITGNGVAPNEKGVISPQGLSTPTMNTTTSIQSNDFIDKFKFATIAFLSLLIVFYILIFFSRKIPVVEDFFHTHLIMFNAVYVILAIVAYSLMIRHYRKK